MLRTKEANTGLCKFLHRLSDRQQAVQTYERLRWPSDMKDDEVHIACTWTKGRHHISGWRIDRNMITSSTVRTTVCPKLMTQHLRHCRYIQSEGMSTCCRMPNLPPPYTTTGTHLKKTKERSTTRNNTLFVSILRVCSERLGRFTAEGFVERLRE